jgi:hypothetical protein
MLTRACWLSIGCLLWIAPTAAFARPQVNSAPPAPQAQTPSDPSVTPSTPDEAQEELEEMEEMEEIEELEEEVGDRDPTYLRTRLVFRYDYRLFVGDATANRLRLRVLYGFGPKQRFGVSFLEPAVQTDTPLGTARGSGDAEVQLNANFFNRERFRMGVAVQSTLPTSSDALLGGATTTIKPSWDLAVVLSSRFELTAAAYYKKSIHTARGLPFKQFEPDVTFNARILNSTVFLQWDSYYDFLPHQFAQTLKPGISRAFGENRGWTVSAYYAVGVNDYARLSQYRYDAGFDVTWFPRKHG